MLRADAALLLLNRLHMLRVPLPLNTRPFIHTRTKPVQCFWLVPLFLLLNRLHILRVPVDAEAVGLDAMQMGQTSRESELISSAKVGGSNGRTGMRMHSPQISAGL